MRRGPGCYLRNGLSAVGARRSRGRHGRTVTFGDDGRLERETEGNGGRVMGTADGKVGAMLRCQGETVSARMVTAGISIELLLCYVVSGEANSADLRGQWRELSAGECKGELCVQWMAPTSSYVPISAGCASATGTRTRPCQDIRRAMRGYVTI